MDNKNIKLNLIFDDIIRKYEDNNFNVNSKIKDGIINEQVFEQQNEKILFICKEHNQLSNDKYDGDYREWWNEGVNFSFSHRISEWSYGILNNFPDFESINSDEKKLKALQSIAFINIKKIAGKGVTNSKELWEYFVVGKEFIVSQINIIEPTIVIFCTSWKGYPQEIFGKDCTYKKHGVETWITEKFKAIHFAHPSSRTTKEANYYWLEKVLKK
jgi:hypothetical protein